MRKDTHRGWRSSEGIHDKSTEYVAPECEPNTGSSRTCELPAAHRGGFLNTDYKPYTDNENRESL